MDTGVITHESLPTLLRSISQRRRQGVLEVQLAAAQLQFFFVQGRVVEGARSESSGPKETLTLLIEAGLVADDNEYDVSTYAHLWAGLQRSGVVEEGDFRRMVKHRVLNHLYGLETAGERTFYTFKVQMVECERDFAPNISVGQVLLDLVALESEGQQFEEFFPDDCLIRRGQEESPALSEEESILYELVGIHGMGVSVLRRQALLSRYHFESSLLSMLSRNIIAIDEEGPQAMAGLGTDALLQALDRSIDDSFEAEVMLASAAERARGQRSSDRPAVIEGIAEKQSGEPAPVRSEEQRFPVIGFSTRCAAWSARIMQSHWTVHLGVMLFLLACLYCPLAWWGSVWKGF